MSVRDTAATATQAKTTSCSVGKNDAGNGFDETSEFVTAASSLATGVGIQDWLDEGSGPASKRQERPKWSLQTESEMHVQRLGQAGKSEKGQSNV
ncbi:hypothetical protein BGW41_007473 [Actinomortierella wolfii]|nr:hypothetical protein BGW41_007473 [Actinomortierella wolfii]